MKLHLKVWRQRSAKDKGYFEDHHLEANETHVFFGNDGCAERAIDPRKKRSCRL